MFSYRNDPDADGVGVAFCDAVGPDGSVLDLTLSDGRRSGDWKHVEAALGVQVRCAQQVHGVTVLRVGTDTDQRACGAQEADALVTTARGLRVAVRVADCVPVLVGDPAAGVVAAAHAGRVGLTAGVLQATLAAMRELGATAVTAWIGPHICGACYEVEPALRDQVAAQLPGAASTTAWGTASLDLGAGAALLLEALGCQVRRHDPCTRTTPSLHSYRRDALTAGRQAGVIWLPAR